MFKNNCIIIIQFDIKIIKIYTKHSKNKHYELHNLRYEHYISSY